ncbi:MAG TPA: energy-coupling factor transporter transmembrane component T [Fimbriimonadaceae bacterium]|nr:energy-coupling factor transporter transmembrane component T [Fimbriimonadaceae bacterium]
MNLPAWLSEDSAAPKIAPGRGTTSARRGLSHISRGISQAMERDKIASGPGLLQAIDPRFKMVALLALIVVATFVHAWLSFALLLAIVVTLAQASNVPAKPVIQIWFAVPLFTLLIMLPATLGAISPGAALIKGTPFTVPGALLAARMVLRTLCCVSLAYLLAATTRSSRLFPALRMLGIPAVAVAILSMMERYVAVLGRVAEEIHMAKISRTVHESGLRAQHNWIAAGMGSLFRRSQALSQGVHRAMVARGFRGEVRSFEWFRAAGRDWAFLIAGLAFVLLLAGLG